MMPRKCQWVKCPKVATHVDVIYWGTPYDACDEHYELIGEDKDYEIVFVNE